MSRVRPSCLTLIAALALGSCMPPDVPTFAPEPQLQAPTIRIGLSLGTSAAALGGGGAWRIVDPDEGLLAEIPAGSVVTAVTSGSAITLRGTSPAVTRRRLLIEPGAGEGTVRYAGREYRGTLELDRGIAGIRVINHVDLEEYLIGVVGAEMGNRGPEEFAALQAQAVASRTYALRHQDRSERGYDLLADVSSQVYNGLALELPLAARAVEETRGEILTWQGEPIDAFFSSTCGGETEDGPAVFAAATRPYLQSISDRDPNGVAWCAISPRYRWQEDWTAAQLTTVLRRTLSANGLSLARAADLTEMRVLDRTATGRIATLELTGRNGRTTVSGQAIRRVLAPPAGGTLRSTDFTVKIGRQGGRVERVTIEGRGYGHAVGMCQYGAIGRARAGQDYLMILTSYFQGTTLSRIY